MRPVALSLVLLPLLLTACAGTVKLDGDVNNFGPGNSGAYVVLDLDGDTVHFFLLSDRTGLCGKLQTAYDDAIAAWDRYQQDTTDADVCNTFSAELADAWGPLVDGNANFAYAFVSDGNIWDLLLGGSFDELTEPSGGTWDQDESWFQLTYFPSDSPYDYAAAEQEGCNWADARDDADRQISSYIANEGDLELEESNSGWRIDFDVDLEDEDEDYAASATGGFGATTCEIDANTMDPVLVLNPWTFMPWWL